jgi:hypothetical protein
MQNEHIHQNFEGSIAHLNTTRPTIRWRNNIPEDPCFNEENITQTDIILNAMIEQISGAPFT